MKIPKLLLQTILVSVTAATLTSCEKQDPEQEKAKTEKTTEKPAPDACPACGMG